MSDYYLFYNSERWAYQIIEADSDAFARSMLTLQEPVELRKVKGCRPDALDVVATLEGNPELAEKAAQAYLETDPEQKPLARAREAFRQAFGRSARTSKYIVEARALADIVARAKYLAMRAKKLTSLAKSDRYE